MSDARKEAQAIRAHHAADAVHVRSEPIREIRGHPTAAIEYDGARRELAVLGEPAIETAVDASARPSWRSSGGDERNT